VVIPCDDRRRSIGDAPSGAQSTSSSSDWGVSEMRRRALLCGGGLVCTGDASSVDAETRVGGSSRFLGERFVLLMRAARGGVGGFLLLVKKSVMERCCDIVSARESVSVNKRLTRSFDAPRQIGNAVNAHATAMSVIYAAWAARRAKVQPWPKEANSVRARPKSSWISRQSDVAVDN
jgi:hypothetical protein